MSVEAPSGFVQFINARAERGFPSHDPHINFFKGRAVLNIGSRAYFTDYPFAIAMIDRSNHRAALKPSMDEGGGAFRKICGANGQALFNFSAFARAIGMTQAGRVKARWNEAEGVLEWDIPKGDGDAN